MSEKLIKDTDCIDSIDNIDSNSESLQKELESLREQLEKKENELAIFVEAGKALTSTLDINKIINIIIEKAEKLVHCDNWTLFLLDKASSKLNLTLAKVEKKSKSRGKEKLQVSKKSVASQVASSKKPLIVNSDNDDYDMVNELTWLNPKNPDQPTSLLCIPMIINSKTIGVLEMCSFNGFGSIDKAQLDLMVQLMDHAAIAIDKANLYKTLEEITVTDDLTQLYNMRYMDNNLEHEIRRCQRYSSSIGSIFLDLDYFKNVNDQYGHRIGSKLLKEVAVILKKNLRDVDIVARFGGDEFVVVLPEVDMFVTEKIAERIRKAISSTKFLAEENLNLSLTASFGVSAFPNPSTDKVTLIDSADKAMYEAKNGGRNLVCKAKLKFKKN